MIRIAMAEFGKIVFKDKLLIDGFREHNFVNAPKYSIRQDYPVNTCIGGIINRLLDVTILQLRVDSLGFDQKLDGAFSLDRQITEGSPNGVLGGQLGVFIVAEDVRQHVG